MRDDFDIKHKFGYSHHIEMQEIEAELRGEGETDQTLIHFKAVAEYGRRHKNDPSFARKQASARGRGEKWVPLLESDQASLLEQFKAALEAIRDGHNGDIIPITKAVAIIAVKEIEESIAENSQYHYC